MSSEKVIKIYDTEFFTILQIYVEDAPEDGPSIFVIIFELYEESVITELLRYFF